MHSANNEVAIVDEQKPAALVVQSETATVLSIIERVAMNPDADIEKMERLMAMHERVKAQQAQQAFAADLACMLPELPVIQERGTIRNKAGGVQSTYALWEDINEGVKPVLSKYGFALTFETNTDHGIRVIGILTHKAGHERRTDILLPLDTSGSKNPVQAYASSVSYGKRYTAGALLNLTSSNDDDDGNAAGGTPLDEENVPRREQQGQQGQQQGRQFYPEDSFKKNFQSWAKKIQDGDNIADRIIALVESKGLPLTDQQKGALRNVKGPKK